MSDEPITSLLAKLDQAKAFSAETANMIAYQYVMYTACGVPADCAASLCETYLDWYLSPDMDIEVEIEE